MIDTRCPICRHSMLPGKDERHVLCPNCGTSVVLCTVSWSFTDEDMEQWIREAEERERHRGDQE